MVTTPTSTSRPDFFPTLYLSPLDELAKNTPNTFYRRYMDDWVWVFPKKQTLRTTMKKQYGILHALRVAMHLDKTFIGKVKKGFDFLRVNLTPTGVTVSDGALSRYEDKVARLYEQGAKPKRIRAYRLRWLVWAGVAFSGAALGTGPIATDVYYLTDSGINAEFLCLQQGADPTSRFDCDSTRPEDMGYLTCFLDPKAGATAIVTGFSTGATTCNASGNDCTFSSNANVGTAPTTINLAKHNGTAAVVSVTYSSACIATVTEFQGTQTANPTAQNIPIFGPFGLLAMLMGLLWFGNRRRKH